MCHELLRNASFFQMLLRFDQDLAVEAKDAGCACGGVLHSARYPRKPRGGPEDLGPDSSMRFSFCCAVEGCRRRVTPPSVRFLGRRVYLGAVVVLATSMCAGLTRARVEKLRAALGVGGRTLDRWRRWWRETFVESRFWKGAQARFSPPVDLDTLPRSLLDRFRGKNQRERVRALLVFLTPLTTSSFEGTTELAS